ncbi:MAG: hypothetical protein H6618_08820 [Deltaproteobacteria bacterium]|nr:hypothetical protein [Deltaproteobacteria bacterium]
MKNIVTSIICWTITTPVLLAADYKLPDPDAKILFGADTKVARGLYTIEWIIKGSAGLFAIMCFVSAGNLARQGNYGRAAGAAIGGVISSIGAYLVATAQS